MDLATHQRNLLALLRSNNDPTVDDLYIRRVAQSRDLEEAKRNVFLWRIFVLERTCALTFTLLRQRKQLGEALQSFIKDQNICPFRETQAPAFLEFVCQHEDGLTAAVAQFELALLKVKNGDSGFFVIDWPTDPHRVLLNLAKNLPVENTPPGGAYQIQVSRSLPLGFEISEIGASPVDMGKRRGQHFATALNRLEPV
jgi:hypothetical protein